MFITDFERMKERKKETKKERKKKENKKKERKREHDDIELLHILWWSYRC